MKLRDEIETSLRSWHRYEIERGASPVIDFDCHPETEAPPAASSRYEVRQRLSELLVAAEREDAHHLSDRLVASIAYLDALLGQRVALADYIQSTQGCTASGWSPEYLDGVRDKAVKSVADLGVQWGESTLTDLDAVEGPVSPESAADVIQKWATELEPTVRELTASAAPFSLRIEHVDLDVYWAYWLDGAGSDARMRINTKRARFTEVQARQFALHEVLGHGLQCASFSAACAGEEVPWVRLTSVHAQQQVLLEGLAQALPLFTSPEDVQLVTLVRLAHYMELVRAQLHIAVNDGMSTIDCMEFARKRAPFLSSEWVGDILADRSVDPLLRSYLWAYPAGIDWFVSLADSAPQDTIARVIHDSYHAPLSPQQLMSLWPEGPQIGGNSRPL